MRIKKKSCVLLYQTLDCWDDHMTFSSISGDYLESFFSVPVHSGWKKSWERCKRKKIIHSPRLDELDTKRYSSRTSVKHSWSKLILFIKTKPTPLRCADHSRPWVKWFEIQKCIVHHCLKITASWRKFWFLLWVRCLKGQVNCIIVKFFSVFRRYVVFI